MRKEVRNEWIAVEARGKLGAFDCPFDLDLMLRGEKGAPMS